jgi:hypothetical protein
MMMTTGNDGDFWFAPKRYGYGAGLPLTWQGWVLCLAYCATVTLAAWLLAERTIFGFAAITLTATAAFLAVCLRKTRGGWRWRWGGEE